MLKFLLVLLIVVAVVYIGAVVYIYVSQASFVYFPDSQIISTPAEHGLVYNDVMLTASDSVRINAWYIPADSPRGAILFCHGNGGNISYAIETVTMLHRLGFSVLAFDYRGYGRSEGDPEEEGIYRDAEAAWNYLVEDRGFSPSRIVLHGRSLGGGVASYLAVHHTAAALILESTFTSIPDMGAKVFPIFPVKLLSNIYYETSKRLSAIDVPVLVIHSRTDEMIPYRQGRTLFEQARQPKEFVEISGTHNSGFHNSARAYSEGIDAFLRRYVQ